MLLQIKRIVLDYTIPVWQIIVGAGGVAWIIIDLMFFKKRTNEKIKDMNIELQRQKTKSENDKSEIDTKFETISKEYSENRELLITLNTKMDLILGNKVVFNGNNNNQKGK